MGHSTMSNLSELTAREIAGELVVLGFPLLLMDAVRRAHPIASSRFLGLPPEAPGRSFAFEDPLTVTSSLIVDLTRGPVIMHMPDTGGRHLSVTLIDAVGEAFASIGSRALQAGSCEITLVGPDFNGEVASGLRAFRAPSDLVWLVSRIQSSGPADMAAVRDLAGRQALVHDGVQGHPRGETALGCLEAPDLLLEKRLAATRPQALLHRLPPLLAQAPRAQRPWMQAEITPRLARLGPSEGWSRHTLEAIAQGVRAAFAGIASVLEGQAAGPGWRRLTALDHAATQSLSAAAELVARIAAPRESDTLTLVCTTDESGRPLRGDELYRLGFETVGQPPTLFGWRLSAHPSDGLADDEMRVVGDNGTRRASGATEIVVGAAAEPSIAAGALPSPPGAFALAMRLYGPHSAALRGDWRMPSVERLGSRNGARAAR